MRTPALLTVAATASLVLAWATGAFAQERFSARTQPVSRLVLERIENGVVIVSDSEERVRFGITGRDGEERATLAREIEGAGTLRARRDLSEPFARFGSSVRGLDPTRIPAGVPNSIRVGFTSCSSSSNRRPTSSSW